MFNIIKVMADFSSSGIWECDEKGFGAMIDYCELEISKELAKEFEAWIDFYDTCFEEDYYTFKVGKAKVMNELGLNLAKKLKKELSNVEIYFCEENTENEQYTLIKHKIEGD